MSLSGAQAQQPPWPPSLALLGLALLLGTAFTGVLLARSHLSPAGAPCAQL